MRTLRRGGRQQIVTAIDELHNEACTLRFLSPASRNDPLARAALREEGKLQAAASHPAILRVRATVADASLGWVIAAAPIEGATIASRFRSAVAFPREQAFSLVDALAEALEDASGKNGLPVTFSAEDVCIREDDRPLLFRLRRAPGPRAAADELRALLERLLRGAGGGRVTGASSYPAEGDPASGGLPPGGSGASDALPGNVADLRRWLADRESEDRRVCQRARSLEESGESLLAEIDADAARRVAPGLVARIEKKSAQADAARRAGDERGYADRLAEVVEQLGALESHLARVSRPAGGKARHAWRDLLAPVTAGLLAGLVFALAGIPSLQPRPSGGAISLATNGLVPVRGATYTDAPAWPPGSGHRFSVALPPHRASARSALVWRLDGRVVARGVASWTAETGTSASLQRGHRPGTRARPRVLHVTSVGSADHSIAGLWLVFD